MHTGDWISGECPRCHSGEAFRKVRADATVCTCRACGYDWSLKRMPPDAEPAEIVRRKATRQNSVP